MGATRTTAIVPRAALAQGPSRLLSDAIPRLMDVDPSIPASISAVCERALARDREARFGSAAEFASALENAAEELSLVATSRELSLFMAEHFGAEPPPSAAAIASRIEKLVSWRGMAEPTTLTGREPSGFAADNTLHMAPRAGSTAAPPSLRSTPDRARSEGAPSAGAHP